MNWKKWFFGEELPESSVVFEGTSLDMLRTAKSMQEQDIKACEACECKNNCVEPEVDKFLNLDILRLAFEIATAASQQKVVFVDVTGMTKKVAEDHISFIRGNMRLCLDDSVVPRKGGETEVVSLNGKVSVSEVLRTAEMLKDFISR